VGNRKARSAKPAADMPAKPKRAPAPAEPVAAPVAATAPVPEAVPETPAASAPATVTGPESLPAEAPAPVAEVEPPAAVAVAVAEPGPAPVPTRCVLTLRETFWAGTPYTVIAAADGSELPVRDGQIVDVVFPPAAPMPRWGDHAIGRDLASR
jgi:hypothetical protein